MEEPVVPPPPDLKQEKPEKKGKGDTRVRVTGYLQVRYLDAFDTNNDGASRADDFRVQRARISVKGRIIPDVSFEVQIDPRSPEISGLLRDAYLQLGYIPYHRLRIGQQKTQFGYENNVSSSPLFTVNRSEVSDNLSRGINLRDIGLGLLGELPLGGGFSMEDRITVVNGAGSNVQADDTEMKNVWGRLGIRYQHEHLGEIRAGASGGIGDQIDNGDDNLDPADDFLFEFWRLGADLEVDLHWAFAAVEYVRGTDELPDEAIDSSGSYVLVAAKTPWDVGPIVRHDRLDDYRRWTAGAYYGLPSADLRLLVNYEHRRDEDGEKDDRAYLWTQVRF